MIWTSAERLASLRNSVSVAPPTVEVGPPVGATMIVNTPLAAPRSDGSRNSDGIDTASRKPPDAQGLKNREGAFEEGLADFEERRSFITRSRMVVGAIAVVLVAVGLVLFHPWSGSNVQPKLQPHDTPSETSPATTEPPISSTPQPPPVAPVPDSQAKPQPPVVKPPVKLVDKTAKDKDKTKKPEDTPIVGFEGNSTYDGMRLPYGRDTAPVEGFNFEEGVDGTDHSKYLWGNAAYALASKMTQAFATYGWCVAIRGVEGGGLVDGMPSHTFRTDEGDVALKCPTEIAITDRREKELADQGLVPLVHCKGTDKAAFFSIQSCNKPKLYDSDSATANARISAQLPYMMATCRFAHYLKSMMRDKIGGFMSRDDCWRYLNRWIGQYVTQDDKANQATKAKFPLREARIDVEEVKGKPGVYRAVAYLRPHFQLDELNVSLRLVAELPAAAK